MKVQLLHPDHDLDLTAAPKFPWWLSDLVDADLELPRVYLAMAAGDEFLLDVAKKVMAIPVLEPEVIRYRQQVLADCLPNRAVIQQIYTIIVDGVEVRRKIFLGGLFLRDPAAILHRSGRILEFLTGNLKQLRSLIDEHAGRFRSAGLRQLGATITEQLTDDYFNELDAQLAELRLPRGQLLSAQVSPLGWWKSGERSLTLVRGVSLPL